MTSRSKLRALREGIRLQRYFDHLAQCNSNDNGDLDLVALNKQLHQETNNLSFSEFLDNAANSLKVDKGQKEVDR